MKWVRLLRAIKAFMDVLAETPERPERSGEKPYNSLEIAKVQKKLKELGFNVKVDGVLGPMTNKAIVDFKRSKGLRPRDFLGPITKALLFDQKLEASPRKAGEPVWLRRAKMELGVKEHKGSSHNKKILGYWKSAFLPFKDDETPWCAGFVAAMLEESGIVSPRSGMARSFTRWGQKLHKPVVGAVVVFWRGSPNGSSGHVGFVTGIDTQGRILVLGGNQSDEVNIKPFDESRVLGYYWPAAVPLNADGTDVIRPTENSEPSSTNES